MNVSHRAMLHFDASNGRLEQSAVCPLVLFALPYPVNN
jgi:hypothetical protein